jgi:hypothetical protein
MTEGQVSAGPARRVQLRVAAAEGIHPPGRDARRGPRASGAHGAPAPSARCRPVVYGKVADPARVYRIGYRTCFSSSAASSPRGRPRRRALAAGQEPLAGRPAGALRPRRKLPRVSCAPSARARPPAGGPQSEA